MTKYWVQVEGHCDLPLTKEELFTRFAGRLSGNTPCAKLGETKWGKLRDHFPDWQSPVMETADAESQPEIASPPLDERYTALRILSTLFRVLACIVGLTAAVTIARGIIIEDLSLTLSSALGGFFGVIVNLAIAEAIGLLIDIERNTRKDSAPPL